MECVNNGVYEIVHFNCWLFVLPITAQLHSLYILFRVRCYTCTKASVNLLKKKVDVVDWHLSDIGRGYNYLQRCRVIKLNTKQYTLGRLKLSPTVPILTYAYVYSVSSISAIRIFQCDITMSVN